MTTGDLDSPAQVRAKRLQFDRYVLDLDRGCLLLDGNEIALRPKTFAVLSYLIEKCGRLVSKDELFAGVWPNVTVTDDALVQSIGELRRALKDDGSHLIKTIPRRGYRFDSSVSAAGFTSEVVVSTPVPATSPATRWRLGLLGGLAILLAAGTLWLGFGTSIRVPLLSSKPAIAILPLVSQSDDPAREYFAEGLTQDVISALGRFPELTVMSWNAVVAFKSEFVNPQEIARNLGVRYQVEGSVLQTGDRVRVTAQLVDAAGRVLWSGRYDEPLADLFALQDKITTQIAGALAIRVAKIE